MGDADALQQRDRVAEDVALGGKRRRDVDDAVSQGEQLRVPRQVEHEGMADARIAAQAGRLLHHRGHQLVGVQRAFHQRAERTVAGERAGLRCGIQRQVAGRDDLEGGVVDPGRFGGAGDHVGRADQHRPRDTGRGDARRRIERERIARIDDAERRRGAGNAPGRTRDQPLEPRMARRTGDQRHVERREDSVASSPRSRRGAEPYLSTAMH